MRIMNAPFNPKLVGAADLELPSGAGEIPVGAPTSDGDGELTFGVCALGLLGGATGDLIVTGDLDGKGGDVILE
ncbi:hypothetical protein L6164_000234 [Bauhinia variegata]|uniref:Uncharacterized protein n=1 Tax=Bauhinia variegata TaxID=167791 RepID=A0ACB9Q862_BAUVA|nr:hypothetical protein L6164_000234 [Bauhinia variegata]